MVLAAAGMAARCAARPATAAAVGPACLETWTSLNMRAMRASLNMDARGPTSTNKSGSAVSTIIRSSLFLQAGTGGLGGDCSQALWFSH